MGVLSSIFSSKRGPDTPSTYKFSYRAKVVTLWVIAAACVLFLVQFSHLLPVFIWAAVAAYLFNPVITFLSERTRVHRFFFIVLLYILVGLLLFWAAREIVPLISHEIAELNDGSYSNGSTLVGQVAKQKTLSVMGSDIELKGVIHSVSSWVNMQFTSQALPLFFGAVERLVFLLVFFIITFYFLLQAGSYRKAFEDVIPEPYREEISGLIEKINFTLGAYIRAQVVLIIIMSSASFVVLSALKIKYAIILSIMTGVLEVIPIVGPISATVIVASMALLQSTAPYGLSNMVLALLVVIAYFVLRQLEDYFIIPNIAARFVKVHPVLGIFSLLVGGSVGGVLGLFLAIPTAAIIKVLFGYLHNKLVE